jgi:hypothetical protein
MWEEAITNTMYYRTRPNPEDQHTLIYPSRRCSKYLRFHTIDDRLHFISSRFLLGHVLSYLVGIRAGVSRSDMWLGQLLEPLPSSSVSGTSGKTSFANSELTDYIALPIENNRQPFIK